MEISREMFETANLWRHREEGPMDYQPTRLDWLLVLAAASAMILCFCR